MAGNQTSPQSQGGRARAAALSPADRREIARQAAKARWANRDTTATSPAKLRRLIEARVRKIKTEQAELRRLAAIALEVVGNADEVVTRLEAAAKALGDLGS